MAELPAAPRMTWPLAILFATASMLAVANLYYFQPLLGSIADDFDVDTATAGTLVTSSQVGYALGVLLFVPLGDVVDRRRFVPIVLAVSAAALAGAALAPNLGLLAAALALVGLTSVTGHVLLPLAGDLADDRNRGRMLSMVSSGIIFGLLISRVLGGIIGGLFGWRSIFGVAAVLTMAAAGLLLVRIPSLTLRQRVAYRILLSSTARMISGSRALQVSMALAGLAFAMVSLFWTALTFLLSSSPFSYSATTIGLFGIVGLVGAAASQTTGHLYDRGLSRSLMTIVWCVLVASWVFAWLGATQVLPLVLAVALLDAGMQAQIILNRTRAFALFPDARARVNTALVVGTFAGGAVGSAMASVLWGLGGWTAIVGAGLLLGVGGLLLYLSHRKLLS